MTFIFSVLEFFAFLVLWTVFDYLVFYLFGPLVSVYGSSLLSLRKVNKNTDLTFFKNLLKLVIKLNHLCFIQHRVDIEGEPKVAVASPPNYYKVLLCNNGI